jgi:hypothetical protein
MITVLCSSYSFKASQSLHSCFAIEWNTQCLPWKEEKRHCKVQNLSLFLFRQQIFEQECKIKVPFKKEPLLQRGDAYDHSWRYKGTVDRKTKLARKKEPLVARKAEVMY